MMRIVEEFLSIQGEGIFAGRLAYFVRFAGCNFNCVGFKNTKKIGEKTLTGCDTLRAVYTDIFAENYSKFIWGNFVKNLEQIKSKPMVVLTGGEPLIHQQNKDYQALLEYLIANEYLVQFETNASIKLMDFKAYKKCYFAMGVKLLNSAMPKHKRINHDAIKSILDNSCGAFFKIVLGKDDLKNKEMLAELAELRAFYPKENFYLMPLGATISELNNNAKAVLEYAIKEGFNYTDRLHIRIYNDKEGV